MSHNDDAERIKAYASMNAETVKKLDQHSRTFVTDWMFAYGLPSTPAALLTFAISIGGMGIAHGLIDGTLTLAEEAKSTPEDAEKYVEAMTSVVDSMVGARRPASAATSGVGAYL